jgi:hypothetical protein
MRPVRSSSGQSSKTGFACVSRTARPRRPHPKGDTRPMYRPNFCAECGTRIERRHWHVWTSRRFCPACDQRFRKARLVLSLSASAALLGLGFVAGRQARPASPPLVIERGQASAPVLATKITTPPADTEGDTAGAITAPVEPRYGPAGTSSERPTDPGETVSVCGARTKKGTPCSRRVRGVGRCWQHKGMPAILPPQKLIVTRN